jgi:hypothetical protein
MEVFAGLREICKDPVPGETEADRKKSMAAFGDQQAKIVSQLQTILKKEWERVKKGG